MRTLIGTTARFRSMAIAACLAASAAGALADLTPTARPAKPMSEVDAMPHEVAMDMQHVNDAMKVDGLWDDAGKRADTLVKVSPLFDKELADLEKLVVLNSDFKTNLAVTEQGSRITRAALGDPAAVASIDADAKSKDPNVSVAGRCDQLKVKWTLANKNIEKQQPVADTLLALGKKYPKSDDVTNTMTGFGYGAATPELKNDLQGAAIAMASPRAGRMRVIAGSSKVLAALKDKPMTLVGTTPDGKPFTTADWKGKVILVDFWATWCAPCKAELPRVKKMYSDYHSKGLEVLGVSNDYKVTALTTFIAQDRMAWPQLFNAEAAADHEWNPITEKMGVFGIPMMFIIDEKGICRSVEGRSEMETLIPKLLAEYPDKAVSMNTTP